MSETNVGVVVVTHGQLAAELLNAAEMIVGDLPRFAAVSIGWHDDVSVARSPKDFLWSTWTRFEPAGDIYAQDTEIIRHHLAYTGPIVIDARTKPGFPKELIVRDDIGALVDRRWREYFPQNLQGTNSI